MSILGILKLREAKGRARVQGLREIKREFVEVVEHMIRAEKITTQESADKLLAASNGRTPFDTGDLVFSGRTQEDPQRSGRILFDVIYDDSKAMMVHETPHNYRQDSGSPFPGYKSAYFLQLAAEDLRDEIFKDIGDAAEEVIAQAPALSSGTGRPRLVKKR